MFELSKTAKEAQLLHFVIAVLGSFLTLSGAAFAELQRPKVSEGTLVGQDGTPLRGPRYSLDVQNAKPPAGWIEALPSRGCNALHVYAEKYPPPNPTDEAGYNRAHLMDIVNRTAASDLYLVIAVGGGVGPEPEDDAESILQFSRDFWNEYAADLAMRTHVIYEIQNETWTSPEYVAQPSPDFVQQFEADVYAFIRDPSRAPQTPILLYSYSYFDSASGVLQDIDDLQQRLQGSGLTKGTQIDWTRTAIAFHGYSGATATKSTLQAVNAAGYAVMETELGTPFEPIQALEFGLVEAYESTRTSWLSFLPLREVDDVNWNDRFDAERIVWAADSGIWPGSSNPPAGDTVALRSPVNGKYVRVDAPSNQLIADADSAVADARFVVVPFASERYVALQAVSNGRYVKRGGGSLLLASSLTPKRFEWIDRPDGRLTLQAKDNWHFVSADLNISSPPPLAANRERGGGPWEAFDVDVLSTLTVSLAGTGSGTVTSDPAGIDCGNDCSETYPHNTSVALDDQAAEGSTFGGWSGSGCGGVVVMAGDRNCTATFTLDAPSVPVIDFAGTDSSTWQVSEGSHHGVTVQVTDPQGIGQVRAWINRYGSNDDNRRGEVSWKFDAYLWPWAGEKMPCSGGGFASKSTSPTGGGEHITLLGCTTSVAGDQRTVTFTVRALPSFGTFGAINDVAAYAKDLAGQIQTFINFDSNFSSSAVDSSAPVLVAVDSGGSNWNIGGSSQYLVTVRVADAGGLEQTRAWINRYGSNDENRRGEVSWKHDAYLWPWAAEKMPCSGGGFASKSTSPTGGGEHITLLDCTTSITGNQRTVTFTVQPLPSFGVFGPINDIAVYAKDLSGNIQYFVNFDTNFRTTN